MLQAMFYDVAIATLQTIYMVLLSTTLAAAIGLPIGTLLFTTNKVKKHAIINKFLATIVNLSRSVPFIILLVALIPVTRLIVGTSIGINAAIVPLTLGAAPFFARLVENAYQSLTPGLIEAGHAMGATTKQMIFYILFPEAKHGLINAVTITAITLTNYSAMAGTVGGGGLGDLAIRYGYQRFNITIMLVTVIILILLVQIIQMCGDKLAKRALKV